MIAGFADDEDGQSFGVVIKRKMELFSRIGKDTQILIRRKMK
jgi:hypothetical protein